MINSTASFSDNSKTGSSTINSWLWNFGDNSFGEIVQNPYHSYDSDPGVYRVSLIISDERGCTDTTFKNIFTTMQSAKIFTI